MRAYGTLLAAMVIGTAASITSPLAQTNYVVGVSTTSPAGNDPGFYADLMRAIADIGGFDVTITPMPIGEIIPAVISGAVQIGAGGGADTEALRAQGLAFTTPIALTSGAFVVRNESTAAYAALTDAIGPIGVTANTQWHQQLTAAGVADIRTFPNFASAMAALETGEVVAYYTNPTVFSYQHDVQGQFAWARIVDTYTYSEFPPTAIAVRAENTGLLADINEALAQLRANGELETIAAQWHHQLAAAQ